MKAAIFDLDGTLVDSAPDIAHAVNLMLADRGAPAQETAFIETLVGEGARMLVVKLHRALGLPEADVDRDTRIYLDHYAARPVADSTLYADAATALPALRAAGIRLGICTNKPEMLARQVLDRLGLLPHLSAVVGADTTPHVKPDPRPLLHTLDLLDVTPEETVYVGDTGIDLACARAAGVPCRIVDWGTGRAVPVEESARLRQFADLLPAAVPA